MSDIAFTGELPRYGNVQARFRPQAIANVTNPILIESAMPRTTAGPATVTMGTFQWIVGIMLAVMTILLGAITGGGGFYLSGLRTDIGEVRKDVGDVRKDVSDIRVEAGKTNTKLDDLTGEVRRHFPR